MAYAHPDDQRESSGFRLPGWLVFLIFVPLQVWTFFKLVDAWGFWWTLLFVLVLGLVAARAARAPWIKALFMPRRAWKHERRRHVFQGILFLAAALTFFLPRTLGALPAPVDAWAAAWPQPWLPLAFTLSLLKSTLQ